MDWISTGRTGKMGSLLGRDVLNAPNRLNPGTSDSGGPGYLFKPTHLVSMHMV